jgi:uncharacterized protein YkwD
MREEPHLVIDGHLGCAATWGHGVIKRYVVPIGILLAIMALGEFLPAIFAPQPSPEDLERDSERIGWTTPLDSRDIAHDVFLRVNDERIARGLDPLVWHEGLAAIAGRWSQEMIATSYRHSTEEFRRHPEFAGTGENIAMGYLDAAEVHVGWMESDGHRDNILLPGYSAMGVGIVCRNDGRMWATQIFGLAHGTPPTAMAPSPAEPVVRDDPGPACPRSRLFPFAAPSR